MGVEVKTQCDRGADHPGPFFSVSIRARQLGPGRTSGYDRLRGVGVFCRVCLETAVPGFLASMGIPGAAAPVLSEERAGQARDKRGSGSGGTT